MELEAQSVIDAQKEKQKQFLNFVKNKALQGSSSFVLEFPFYHVNVKKNNSRWASLSKNQVYFLALKQARYKVSQVLFNLILEKKKSSLLKKRLQSIIEEKAKYYIFSEKVFQFQVHSQFSFISTAKVHLKISFVNLKQILDKEGLLHGIKSKFNVLPMFNLLNTTTGYAKNWWQSSTEPLFSLAVSVEKANAANKNSTATALTIKNISPLTKETSLDKFLVNVKKQFLNHFAEQAQPLSLYLFRPSRFYFKNFLSSSLLKKSAFYPIKIASYLEPDLILQGDVTYSFNEQKRILTILLSLKVFKTASKEVVVVFKKEKKWSLESNTVDISPSRKIKTQILKFFKEAGDTILKELVGVKNKALLQAYPVVLVVKGSLAPADLYQFISIVKFHIREVLNIKVQTLSRSEFHLKVASTLKPKDIAKKIKHLNLPNYTIKAVSLFSDKSKIGFFLKKHKNK